VALGVVTAATKILTGWWAARRAGMDTPIGLLAGAALVAHGEFSVVIAGLGVGAGREQRLASLSAAYVVFLAVLGPLLARWEPRRHNAQLGEGGAEPGVKTG
jgi:CPA2 family monovalent cation:H+ antiporter-2